MKYLTLLFVCVFACPLVAQDTLSVPIVGVTLYERGAQVGRLATHTFREGRHTLIVDSIDRFFAEESLQVGVGDDRVQLVSITVNPLNLEVKSPQMKNLEAQQKVVQDSMALLRSYLQVYEEEKAMLTTNRSVKGTGKLTGEDLANFASAYRGRLFDIENSRLRTSQRLSALQKQLQAVQGQMSKLRKEVHQRLKTISITYKAPSTIEAQIDLSYSLPNAGWELAYDLRVEGLNQDVVWGTRAALWQQSDLDWDDVEVTLSTGDPLVNLEYPKLDRYFLTPHNYLRDSGQRGISAKVVDAMTQEPILFANVECAACEGVTTDFNGAFHLPHVQKPLSVTVRYVGYSVKQQILYPGQNIIQLEQGVVADEVVVAYGSRAGGRKKQESAADIGRTMQAPIAISKNVVRREIKLDHKITIKHHAEKDWLPLYQDEIPITSAYLIVPKKEPAAFLQVKIEDVYKYDLSDAEVSIYFKGKYQGKYNLVVDQIDKDLQLVVGRDQQIKVERELVDDFSDRRIFGSKVRHTKNWQTTVLNGSTVEAAFKVLDQVPISTSDRIKVSIKDVDGGDLDSSTGEVSWQFSLPANGSKTVNCHYEVECKTADQVIVD